MDKVIGTEFSTKQSGSLTIKDWFPPSGGKDMVGTRT